ncbi:AAA family ATPase [Acinetobacter baumannii]|uniref:AAA family ATPase n=3 Tax=Acinetobacter pittii TaxID=48296 RepID=UPI000696EE85|nr:AAA family ATPase [Acinetobacter pittii]OCY97984.1 hypothetical protein BFR94_07505 [Acinetobacter pittii]OCZ48580.1 hypothetical protein BFR73_04345 [Acinetobacter pittii]OTU32433.1 hypothetical protein CAT58_18015 [Acinetobacter pittii]
MEKFTWIKTFEQISEWLLNFENRQSYLIEILEKIGVEGGLLDYELEEKYLEVKNEKDKEKKKVLSVQNTVKLKEIDPFTFISLILKNSKFEKLIKLLSNLKELIPELYIPLDFKGVPTPNPQGSWFFAYKFDRKPHDIAILWSLFKAIHKKENISQKFDNALDIKYTALASLSQMLFVFFPTKFFPVDGQTQDWLVSRNLLYKKKTRWKEYSDLINTLKNNYRVNFAYLSYTCWFINQGEFNKIKVEELLSVRLNRITEGVEYIKGFVTDEGKQIALEVTNKSNYFNIIIEEKIPNDFNLKFEFKKVGNANLERHAPKLANREVCVIRTQEKFSWYDFLLVLDWYEGSSINSVSHGNLINNSEEAKNMIVLDEPLNQILSGPPGTGKTYATTELAVKIAVPEWYALVEDNNETDRHSKIKEKYDELIQKNQIAFTTFHQSFAYEDFIEGLKAYIPEDQDKIAYQVEDGVFKRMAIAATKSQGVSDELDIGLNQEPTIWKISLGERWETERRQKYFENDQARIGWSKVGDLREDRTEKEQTYYDSLKSNTHSTLYDFSSRIKIGDVLLCLKDQKTIQAIGVVKSDYYFDPQEDDDYSHVRDINWIAKNINFNIFGLNDQTNLTLKTVYELYRMNWSKITEELKNQGIVIENVTTVGGEIKSNHNYVLIIDEINRGNISRIFGELITLIEDDKRSGKSDARELTLPYSKEPFTVPSNLYLIGTMNTADKSLTQLDLALRRRFEFKEIVPDIHVLESANQYDFDIVQMLDKINQRIQCLKGKDFQIGHAYFMPLCKKIYDEKTYIETLQRILTNKILPLLQEYFFSTLDHIGLVLNDNSLDEPSKRIVVQANLEGELFPFAEKLPKFNALYSIRLNKNCFKSVERIKQIYM